MVKGVVYFIHQVKLIDGKFASALLKSLFSSDVINDDLVVNEGLDNFHPFFDHHYFHSYYMKQIHLDSMNGYKL